MLTRIDRRAAGAGLLGGVMWVMALTGFVFGEIEYNDPTRVSPIPEWASAVALSLGAVLIGTMLLALRRTQPKDRPLARAGISVALAGAALALVPLWPMIFFGPLLVALGMAGRGIADIRRGDAGGAAWLHAVGVPLALASGMAFDAAGISSSYGGFVFAFAVAGGLIWLSHEAMAGDARPSRPATRVDA